MKFINTDTILQSYCDSPLHLESSKTLKQRSPAERDTFLLDQAVKQAPECDGSLIRHERIQTEQL